jgi:hypothetical protein
LKRKRKPKRNQEKLCRASLLIYQTHMKYFLLFTTGVLAMFVVILMMNQQKLMQRQDQIVDTIAGMNKLIEWQKDDILYLATEVFK